MRFIRSNVLGLIAIFIALSGVAVAVQKDSVKSRHIVKGGVKSSDVLDDTESKGGLAGKDIAPDTLTEADVDEGTLFNDDSLTGSDIAEGSLGVVPAAANTSTLDGQDSSAFLGVNGKAADANTFDGQDSSEFLGSTAKAADAQVLDGVESDDFVRVSGLVNGANGNPLSTGITSVRNGEGDYTVTINDGTFPNSGTSCALIRPVISPVGNEFHAAVWNEAGCLIGGGAEFDVLTFDAAAAAEDATFGFVVDVVP